MSTPEPSETTVGYPRGRFGPAARWAEATGWLALYAALALAATWPLARELGTSLPQGTERTATVPLASAWSLWWTADRAAAGFEHFWDAPIFFPTPRAFAFSEPIVLGGLAAAPLLWAGASPVLALDLLVLAALALNGAFARALLRDLGLGPLASGAGGALLCLLPYVHHELGVLTLVPLAGVLACLHALLRLSRAASIGRGLRLGVAFSAAYLLCGQHAVFLALAAAPAALCLLRREHFTRRGGFAALATLAAAALLLGPVLRAQLEMRREHAFERRASASAEGAATLRAYWLAPTRPLLPLPGVTLATDPNEQPLFPGTLKLALAALGIGWGVGRRELRRFTIFLALLGAAAVALSLLPRSELLGVEPFAWLRQQLPALAQIRSFWRASMLLQVALALLAALGLEAFARLAKRHAAQRRALGLGAAALALVAVVELWPPPPRLAPAPAFAAWRPWSEWLAAHVEPGAALVLLPTPDSSRVGAYEETARFMLLGSAHGRPMVGGYSSFFPRSYRSFERFMRGCPSASAWAVLHEVGLRTLVVRSSWLAAHPGCGPSASLYRQAVAFEALDVEVWQAAFSPPDPGDTPDAP